MSMVSHLDIYIRTLLYSKISYISKEWTQKHLIRRHYCMNGYFIGYCNFTGNQTDIRRTKLLFMIHYFVNRFFTGYCHFSGHCSDIICDGHKNNRSKDIIMSIVSHLDTSILELYRTANSINQDGNKDTLFFLDIGTLVDTEFITIDTRALICDPSAQNQS